MLNVKKVGLGILVALMAMQTSSALADGHEMAGGDHGIDYASRTMGVTWGITTSASPELAMQYHLNAEMQIRGGLVMNVGEEFTLNAVNLGFRYYLGESGDVRSFGQTGLNLSNVVIPDDGDPMTPDPELGLQIPLMIGAEYSFNNHLALSAWTGLNVDVTPDFAMATFGAGFAGSMYW